MASGKYAAPHVSTSLAKNLRQALDEENSDCDILGTSKLYYWEINK